MSDPTSRRPRPASLDLSDDSALAHEDGVADDAAAFSPGASRGDDRCRARVRALEHRLHAQQVFTDALDEVRRAVEGSPPGANVMALLERSLESVMEATDSEAGALLVRDEDSEDLVFVVSRGDVPPGELAWTRIPRGHGIAHWVARHRRAVIVNDVASDERFYPGIDRAHGFHTRGILAAPVMDGDRLVGVVEVLNKREGALYTLADQHRLELMCHFDGELLAGIAGAPAPRRRETG